MITLPELTLDAIASPYWSWDSRSARYRDKQTGRFLSQQNLERLQQRHVAAIGRDIDTIGDLLLRGQISLETWQQATGTGLKTLWLHQAALGKGGVRQMTSSDYLAVGRSLREQYGYLQSFASDINRGYSIGTDGRQIPMTEKRFKARLQLYTKAGSVGFEYGKQEVAKKRGMNFARRFVRSSHPCSDCPRYARMGVQPIGILPLPRTRCQCRGNCECEIIYYRNLEDAIRSTKII